MLFNIDRNDHKYPFSWNKQINRQIYRNTREPTLIFLLFMVFVAICGLLNLSNELEKEIKCEVCQTLYRFFAMSSINSIKQGHEC